MSAVKLVLTLMLALLFIPLTAQVVSGLDESKLYAESKQLNQFLRRFNGEEDEVGKRFYPGDKQYRNVKLRKKYLATLFDASNGGMSDALKAEFVKTILDKPEASILDFHGPNWYAVVQTIFAAHEKPQSVTLFMGLEKDHLGSKWVITRAYADAFKSPFVRDTTKVGRFIHPMSHELDFMNLRKAFANKDSIGQFASRGFQPDHLTLLLYEIKKGDLAFKSVERVNFHFFQISGWYFELSEFNRPGYNNGWLISNLVKLKDDSEKNILQKYLYYEAK